jgi:hypothetical protein
MQMVDRVAPNPSDYDDIETVESLLAMQKRALRRPWRPSLRTRHPKPSEPAAEFPPVRSSIAAFQRAIQDGRITETEFHEFDPAEVMRVFLVPAGDAALALQFPSSKAEDRPVKKTQVAAARAWLAATYSDGIPAGITNKMLALTYREATKAPMSERTMRRARQPTADEP